MATARTVYDITAKAREAYASEFFGVDRISQAIEDRARQGFRDLRVIQVHPVDLSSTAAALMLEDWLDENGYRYAWRPIPPMSDPQYSPLAEDCTELAIFW